MNQTGFWYSFGRLCYKFFHGLEWTYEHLTPNKIFIVAAFACFIWWMAMQNKYNKKAIKAGTYK
jgi:hypothetical protein